MYKYASLIIYLLFLHQRKIFFNNCCRQNFNKWLEDEATKTRIESVSQVFKLMNFNLKVIQCANFMK